ncbi:transposase [Vulcanisaeta souniana]|uniref:transposase n=1 Tax=Vulcanisaeta souniana TaxID=164452 RepID=UPI000A5881E6|nr:transposase [Vulcanisaeta souniana]
MSVLDVTVVGVDVGVKRSVFAFVGVRARLLSDLVVIYGRQNGVSLMQLGTYDAVTRAYVVDVRYPGVDKYRGAEMTGNIVSKTLGAMVRAIHNVQRIHKTLVGLVLEDLRQFNGYKHDLAKARAVWGGLMMSNFSKGVSKCSAVKVSWFWISYEGEVMIPTKDSIPIVLVEPEYTSSTCPRCGAYLDKVKGKVTCDYCGFKGDRDVIGAINIAWRGFLVLTKCVREGALRI